MFVTILMFHIVLLNYSSEDTRHPQVNIYLLFISDPMSNFLKDNKGKLITFGILGAGVGAG
jgi:hypothetical protein